MSSTLRDIRHTVRGYARTPGFTVVAILTIALGVGANTAIFSVVNAVVLRPLPYPDADRIVRVWPEKVLSPSMLAELREQTESFRFLSAFTGRDFTLTGDGDPIALSGTGVSTNHFSAMGVHPFLGRTFQPEEEFAGRDQVAILSHGFWQRRFGADPDIVGRSIPLDGHGYGERTVIGVMPADYVAAGAEADVWVPLVMDSAAANFDPAYGLWAVARLRTDVSVEQARAELRFLVASFRERHPTQFRESRLSPVPVVSLHETIVSDVRPTLLILLGAVALVLLIACANVANLLLARTGAREKEIAIRLAMGAGRQRLVRQLLTESTLLGLVGGAVGIGAAWASMSWMVSNLPGGVPRAQGISLDLTVLAFAVGASVAAGMIFGIAPALRATQPASGVLREGNKGVTLERRRHRLNNALVMSEIALAVVLVVASGLLFKSFVKLHQVELGFNAENLLTVRPLPATSRYEDSERVTYFRQVTERINALPGVEATAVISRLPVTAGNSGIPYLVEGQDLPPGTVSQVVNFRTVSPGYFRTLGVPLVSGRSLTESDVEDAPFVGVVNQAFVRKHWPTEDPIGKQILSTAGTPLLSIVGVVGDVRQHSLAQASQPELYLVDLQTGYTYPFIVIRTAQDPVDLLPSVRAAIWEIDGDTPIVQGRTMEQVITESMGDTRFFTSLFASFAFLAFSLGVIGVYGVMSFIVGRQTREIGIRLALGASAKDVVRMVLSRGLVTVASGLVLGLAGALAVTRLLANLLYNVAATDPVTFALVALGLGVAGTAANLLPAYRAAKVDPVTVLNEG